MFVMKSAKDHPPASTREKFNGNGIEDVTICTRNFSH